MWSPLWLPVARGRQRIIPQQEEVALLLEYQPIVCGTAIEWA
jgi:hypothetical protein